MQIPKTLILKHSLANAFSHNGKAVVGAVIAKVLGEAPELKKEIKELQNEISKTIEEVNKLSVSEQESKLSEIFPEFFEQKKEQIRDLPELPNAQIGKVITRLPPEPNGYLHLGHAISFFFNYYYAKKYKGALILRFEDTNPEAEKKEYYNAIIEDLEWLKINYAERKNNSDDISKFYEYAEHLIKTENAYVCTCELESSRKLRFAGKECKCRKNSTEQNKTLWEKMLSVSKEGSAVLRLKGDMKSKNTVMRDPTLFRIVEAPHPLQGKKYRVWPLYDFANAVEDSICGVTHVLRSNEFVQRNELQNKIRTLLGLKNPEILSYSRINAEGVPTSKRKILSLMEQGIVKDWDDPRLVTIKALRRRGILPETLYELALEVRMTLGSTTVSWDALSAINRKLLDPVANRYFFVPEPVKLEVENAPAKTAELELHPDDKKRGVRKIKTGKVFYIPKADAEKLKAGDIFRLKDLFNVKIEKMGKTLQGSFAGEELLPNTAKLQWVAEKNIPAKILVPGILLDKNENLNPDSLKIAEGLCEETCAKLKANDIVQFERFGFVKIEKAGMVIEGILVHK